MSLGPVAEVRELELVETEIFPPEAVELPAGVPDWVGSAEDMEVYRETQRESTGVCEVQSMQHVDLRAGGRAHNL
jgi:hypothetical protein